MKRRALVTGGSRGIGAAIAEMLAVAGHDVIINYNNSRDRAEQLAARLREGGASVECAGFDVRDRAATAQALATLTSKGEPITVLVNNAGIVADAPFPALGPEEWESVTRTTLDGFYNVTHPLTMPMVRKRWGRIINIASISGMRGNRGQVNYSAAKAGLIGATRSLALELAKRKITVNAVAPGLIDTEMLEGTAAKEIVPLIPMKRLGEAAEVAKLVGFLVSEDAAYITGQVIGIDGGLG